jgi:hypothetical protein
MRLRLFAVVLMPVICTACDQNPAPETIELTADCPTQAEAEERLTAYINEEYWSPSQREIWTVTAIGPLAFGPMQVGAPDLMAVDSTVVARQVCPLRITYSFTVTKADGSTETTEMGAGKTHYFYRDPFGGWAFRAG